MLSKDQGLIMRGLAIMFIALHNFLHLPQFGLVQENEMYFHSENYQHFLAHLYNPSWVLIGDVFSFIGWCGVPVFVFLSGYGLARKYQNVGEIKYWPYVKHSYVKLILLLLPAAVFFIVYQAFEVSVKRAVVSLFSLTLMNNILSIGKTLPSAAPTFWYFPMTFQLYLLFPFIRSVKTKKLIVGGAILLLLLELFTPDLFPTQRILHYLRVNSFAWLPLFFIGIGAARSSKDILLNNNVFLLVSMLLCFSLLFFINISFYLWIIMPLVALLFFMLTTIVVEKNKLTKAVGLWLGKLSPYIFVAHPIILLLVDKSGIEAPLLVLTLFYVILFILLSIIYKYLHIKIQSCLKQGIRQK